MIIRRARHEDIKTLRQIDSHIPEQRLSACIHDGSVYLLEIDGRAQGLLRFSLFWQTIPFLDLIFINEPYRGKGYGRKMLEVFESAARDMGSDCVMTSTQADEDAWRFYEHLGYTGCGEFYPPGQEAAELVYTKRL